MVVVSCFEFCFAAAIVFHSFVFSATWANLVPWI